MINAQQQFQVDTFYRYFNDDFYSQTYHQCLFSATEAYASWILLLIACSSNKSLPNLSKGEYNLLIHRLSTLLAISLAHLSIGGLDQFIAQNIYGDGHISQQSRNAGFMITDIIGVLLPAIELFKIWNFHFSTDINPATCSRLENCQHHLRGLLQSKHFLISIATFAAIIFFGMF